MDSPEADLRGAAADRWGRHPETPDVLVQPLDDCHPPDSPSFLPPPVTASEKDLNYLALWVARFQCLKC